MSSVQPTDHLSTYFSVRDISTTVDHLAFILQISIPHDIISTLLDDGGDWINCIAMATILVTWLVYAIAIFKKKTFKF